MAKSATTTLCCLALQALIHAVGTVHSAGEGVTDPSWTSWGGNLNNTRSAVSSPLVNQTGLSNLSVAWEASLLGAVSAAPFVYEGSVVVPTWAGWVYSLDSVTGSVKWQRTVDDYVAS